MSPPQPRACRATVKRFCAHAKLDISLEEVNFGIKNDDENRLFDEYGRMGVVGILATLLASNSDMTGILRDLQ